MNQRMHIRILAVCAAAMAMQLSTAGTLRAQDRLRTMPGYDQYARMSAQLSGAFKSGALQVAWVDSGKAIEYTMDGVRHRYVIAARRAAPIGDATPAQTGSGRGGRGGGGGPARGRQFEFALSPDRQLRAFYRDRNLWMSSADSSNPVAVTTDGSEEKRIKYGTASWVYGEELGQNTAIWWAPDASKLAYYRFDESPVPDYYLQLGQTRLQSSIDVEAYPKAGVPNPIVDVFVYDVAAKQSVRIDVRDGKPFTDDVVGHYVYSVGWSPDGSELLFNRTNRRQNILEYTACNPGTGACRVVVRDEWPASWVDNTPTIRFLADGKRFIWESERTGWRNYYLYDLTGKLITPLTSHEFEVANIVRVDEKAGVLYYMARSGDNHMKLQLHRVGLDGKNDRRLTDPAFNHAVNLAPDGRHFVDVAQAHDRPPVTRLLDLQGRVVAELARSDLSKADSLGLRRVEMFTFRAADSTTILHGMLHRPSNFDSTRRYPVLVSVYGGPATNGARELFTMPSALTEYGFLVVTLDARSAGGRGKRFLDAIYLKLGVVEIDDLAAGIKSLWNRPYVDRTRVGIYGTSYGGYASAMALVRYPDVFHAASAGSPVTDWRHYDTIYTERYMWTPQGNTAGYDAGSVMTYVRSLRGRLMIYFGTADNNVHPSNSLQLIQALQRAQKSFEVQVGPDLGHTGLNQQRMMEFFIENLVMRNGAIQ
ncbi:MAG TPA: DPP IV N-terminal domain-containing protein [Gemmatimonadaceae bacterium]|nr:DPP IV N-terminal domain-containing protein [Gemmatimonadaceae bacterium]